MKFRMRVGAALGAGVMAITGLAVADPAEAFVLTTSGCQQGNVVTYDWSSIEFRLLASGGSVAADLQPDTGLARCPGVFPSAQGAAFSMRINRCVTGSQPISSYRTFTYAARQDIATSVLPGTCFLVGARGTSGINGKVWRSRIIWPQRSFRASRGLEFCEQRSDGRVCPATGALG